MEQVFLGEYLRQRREDLGLTQAQLCEGICEPITVSRLENGKQVPSYTRIKALLQRLGLPGSRYFALLSRNEENIELLQKELRSDVICFERATAEERPHIREQALAKLEELEQLAEPDDRIIQQYILSTRVSLGKPDGAYNFEDQLDMLLEAIRLTVPRFDLEEINLGRYSMAETTIINQIARCYSHMGQKTKAIDIYRQLLKYIDKNDRNLPKYANHFCLIAHNYAINLSLEKRYQECVEIADRGRQVCVRYGDYQFLPGFLAILAECHYFMDEKTQSAKRYMEACYIYEAIGEEYNLRIIQQEMKDRLNLDMPC